MKEKNAGWGIRTLRAYLSAGVLFGLLTLGAGALLYFTPLPEMWIPVYMLVILCIGCLFIGLYGGSICRSKGFLFGLLYAAGFLVLLLLILTASLGISSQETLLQPRFLLCLFFGALGGVLGKNLRI